LEHQKSLEKKSDEDQLWAFQELANIRTIELLERAKARANKEKSLALQSENQLKALEDKKR
jgi:hypothetical protein